MATAASGYANGPRIAAVPPSPRPEIRQAVRDLLLSSAAFCDLTAQERREMAEALVKVCHAGISLLHEEAETTTLATSSQPSVAPSSGAPVLAMAQNAGQQFSGVAASRVAGTTQAILNAVSFPRFVTELINGVFKALVDSNQQQMNSYLDLMKNVAASTDGFADLNSAPGSARQWLVESFPGSFELDGSSSSGGGTADSQDRDFPDSGSQDTEQQIRLRDGASMPSEGALRTALGLEPSESVPSGDPEATLVPYARRVLARQRQQMLASMVMLGMQRIVIESGRLNAAMRFHIDTRSAANVDEGSRFDLQNRIDASAKFGGGPWSVQAKMQNTIGYVSTQKNQTSEEMNTDLDLNSSVELYFKTDYLPLDRLAGRGQVDRIRVNTLNPEAEDRAAMQSRQARETANRQADTARSSDLDRDLLRQGSSGATASGGGTAAGGSGGGAAPGATGGGAAPGATGGGAAPGGAPPASPGTSSPGASQTGGTH